MQMMQNTVLQHCINLLYLSMLAQNQRLTYLNFSVLATAKKLGNVWSL